MTAAAYDYSDDVMDFDEVLERFDPVMGMEVHVELATNTKMFSASSAEFGDEPNSNVDPTCLGLPGALPVVNRKGVEWAITIGLALNCSIAESSRFARKNYFYPDQPKNYQISQYDEPIAYDGHLDVTLSDGTPWRIEIERAHMEEDTGKLTHLGGADGRIHGATQSLVDCNRAGVPLIEIVTKPIEGAGERAPEVAKAYVTALRDLVKALGVSDARMDQGSMRVDSNLSLREKGTTEYGTRTETKNINSLKSVEQAVRFEMQRQAACLVNGVEIIQETRHYQEADGSTSRGRPKETMADYRYFNDPDLPPVLAPREWVEEIRATLPEMPWIRRARVQKEWGLSDEELRDLVNAGALDLVADTVEAGASASEARSWWVSYLSQKANEAGTELDGLAITPAQVARVAALVAEGKLTNKLARQAVDGVLAGEGDVDEVVAARGLEVVRGDGAIEKAVDDALAANPDIVEKYRAGNTKVTGAIVGAVMKATRGKADPAQVNALIAEKLS
ncbi:Asp-tRNA(Asn)/Glu-tRNA(Gln) amidotransferase subunit GatB [Corynebacterium bovis]|uniref:Aspartyl/glutamyl-tRNA(Asn/Gln) amidotransferase subunit B n=1 Tax=Corynebacterium bovis DSM 20582 = CIP 54.80 TaxID=927655 RepID=A0A8H9YBP7_9CORY|nr:Asp-tRNA(Asn)/Glu-tRNA(Gln) amidotransferase subunit GatB [Corynebacterium bovis]MBB3116332.1 aspartyl-tRNA(Asn)/glutamyl-tRNA(Gln) amidotransferase subunit B [Corynebacterium bovis DSM 20582 = CIP 54.80]QQC47572.1 Asp-tRNA(Asn)/Glu-tRNA(Gln) amidotransferase subunit GatB [Corynebacterium bovis]RRQ14440.1 Asp-tRNA(Asn)/Glu-tRNA(Gln) amidotransferase subunit GatB [Corynebacterium bovis]WJY77351.1 Aspartyl/glutamyl-tRNA(Asn/Gln) amidotransferase subunit B [Corynebacterium bovis DSM 20582 = CIP